MLTKRRRDTSIVAKFHCRVSVRGFSIEHTLFPYGELGSGLVMLRSFVSECSESLLHDVIIVRHWIVSLRPSITVK